MHVEGGGFMARWKEDLGGLDAGLWTVLFSEQLWEMCSVEPQVKHFPAAQYSVT